MTTRLSRLGILGGGLGLALGVLLGGCGAVAGDVPYVELARRQVLPEASGPDAEPLRVAVAAVLSPEGNIDSYAGLGQFLGDRLGRPVELVQRRTYAEINDLVAGGAVDLAFVCTSAYVAGTAAGSMELLVVPEVDTERVYYSLLIVPDDSSARAMADLRDGVFAFTDPMSHTGRVYPTHLVQKLGEEPGTFFSSTFYTYSHDRAINAVAGGLADGAAVHSLVLDQTLAGDSELAARIRVIHRSAPFGIPPVVVPAGLADDVRQPLQRVLLDLHLDPSGRAILSEIGVDRFVVGSDADYEDVRRLIAATRLQP